MDRNPVKLSLLALLGLAFLSLLPVPAMRGTPGLPAAYESAEQDSAIDPADYDEHVGLNACQKDTGVFAGEITMVFQWDGWKYVLRNPGVAGRTTVLGERIVSEIYGPLGPQNEIASVTTFTVTSGKCPDGRP